MNEADLDYMCGLVEDFAHAARDIGWTNAAEAVRAHLSDPPEDDEWTDDYTAALRGIAAGFDAAAQKAKAPADFSTGAGTEPQ